MSKCDPVHTVTQSNSHVTFPAAKKMRMFSYIALSASLPFYKPTVSCSWSTLYNIFACKIQPKLNTHNGKVSKFLFRLASNSIEMNSHRPSVSKRGVIQLFSTGQRLQHCNAELVKKLGPRVCAHSALCVCTVCREWPGSVLRHTLNTVIKAAREAVTEGEKKKPTSSLTCHSTFMDNIPQIN